MEMILLSLIQNISILVSLTVIHQIIVRKWEKSSIKYQILSGILFGSVGIVGMMTPLTLKPGIIFDGRSIILGIAGLFGGPLVASLAAGICACYRLYLGGAGALVGTAVIVEAASLGVGYHLLRRRNDRLMGIFHLLSFGFLVHVVMLVLLMALPGGAGQEVLRQISLPVLLVYPFAVMLVSQIFIDNEERLQAEKALKDSEERHRTLFQTSMEGILCVDMKGRLVQVNDAYCRMSGYSESELLTMSIPDLEALQTSAEVAANIQKIAVKGYAHFESCHRRKDGSTYDIEASTQYLPNSDGLIFAFIRDISERKHAEEALRRSEEKYRELVENANSIILRMDDAGKVTFINEFAQRFFGYSEEEILGKNVVGTIVPPVESTGRDLRLMIESIAANPDRYANNINENMRSNGERVWIAWTNKPVFDKNGRIREVLCVGNDITERKQTEESLLLSEERYSRLFEDASLGIYRSTPGGKIINVNPAYVRMFGFDSPEDAMSQVNDLAVDLYVDPSRRSEIVRMLLDGKGPVRSENLFRRKDGSIFTADLHMWTVHDTEGKLLFLEGFLEDITERKRAEDALRESVAMYRTLVENIPQRVFMKDTDSCYVSINEHYARDLGIRSADVFGKTDYDFFPGELADKYRADDKRIMKTGVTEELQEHYISQGKEVWVQTVKTPVRDANGKVNGVFGIFWDITERKQAEDELRRSQRQLADIIEFIPDATFVINNEGRVIAWNRAMEAMSGIPKSKMIGKGDFEYSLPFFGNRRPLLIDLLFASEEKTTKYYDLVSTVGDAIVAETYAPQAYGGQGAYLGAVATALFDEQGNVEGAIESIRDITERKLAEIALRESKERFSRFFRASPVGTSITRLRDGQFADVNDAFLRLFGYTREEVIGHTRLELGMWVDPNNRAEQVEILQNQGRVVDFEVQLRRKSGEIIDVLSFAEQIEIAGEQYVLVIAYDITERKRAEEERKKLEEQLFQAQKMESVGRLAGGVAHDFNNMLGVIIGRAEMGLQRNVSNDKIRHNLQEILKAALRSADLTRQLLAFARKQTAIPKILDLNDTISGMIMILRRLIGENIDMSWQPGLDLWKVKIDPSQVDQILANLVVNARDAIPGVGSITLRTENFLIDDSNRADHLEFIPGQYVLLSVSDTGTGMSKEVCENIFEPFFTTKELGKGTGLGLSTVYGIVKQNDGFINVASEQGKGTTFKIYLPRFKVETEHVPPEEIAVKRQTGTETVLLVEDDEAILNLSTLILEELGYTVIAAQTPVQAIHLAREHPGYIHLLITDVVMPEMNGRELAEKLSTIRPNLKCLYMSGYTADVIAHSGILDEGLNFIQKPFGSFDLAARVRQVLDHME
ncbi:PAS/PAC sensor hybrid histidine kinase (modular protein) [Syntrophobacter sp. SbD1]|nr:PAS/PAC sensor hybrid histidine kinase (modular protein) [Syntrophobacter sp. SbD1]